MLNNWIWLSILVSPAFPPPAFWCHDFHSRDFHPCNLVPRFPIPRIPPLHSGAAISTPAFLPLPRFQSPRETQFDCYCCRQLHASCCNGAIGCEIIASRKHIQVTSKSNCRTVGLWYRSWATPGMGKRGTCPPPLEMRKWVFVTVTNCTLEYLHRQ